MPSDGTDKRQQAEKSFREKHNDRFLSRLMSKETSIANSSSRVLYYGEAPVAVPFRWESHPGAPKHPLMTDTPNDLPPLTPPPSYYSDSKSKIKQKRRNSNIFSSISRRFSSSRKALIVSLSSSSWSSSSSSSFQSSSRSMTYSLPSFSMKDKHEGSLSLSDSAVGFYFKQKNVRDFRGCYPLGNMKNAILSTMV